MRTTLGEIFEIGSGGTPSKAHPEYYGGEIPWVKTGDLKDEYLYSVEDYITEEGLNNSSAKMYQSGTVLIAMYGATIGATSILKFDACTNQACAAFKPCKDVMPEYLYYFLRSKKQKFINDGVGGAQPNISAGYLKNVNIEMRTIEEQERVVTVLDKLNGIVQKRQTEIGELDDLINARFVEMFGNGKFPSIDLIDLITEGSGLSYGIVQPGDDGTGDMGVLRPVDMVDGKISLNSIKYIDRTIGDGFKKTELTGDELLITVRGTTGITALTDKRFKGMNVTRGIAVIRFDRSKINPVYLNAFINTEESQRYIQEHTRGATLQQINLADLRVQRILVPPMQLQEEFSSVATQVNKSKVAIQKALDETQLLFDSLMQKYFG